MRFICVPLPPVIPCKSATRPVVRYQPFYTGTSYLSIQILKRNKILCIYRYKRHLVLLQFNIFFDNLCILNVNSTVLKEIMLFTCVTQHIYIFNTYTVQWIIFLSISLQISTWKRVWNMIARYCAFYYSIVSNEHKCSELRTLVVN
jgi:hypothetical protein